MVPVPDRAALLAELDRLPHPARMRRVHRLGFEARGTAALAGLIASLETQDAYEARLALALAISARDAAAVLRALEHASAGVRAAAAKVAPRVVTDDDALVAATLRAAPDARRRLLRALRRTSRPACADRLLPELEARSGPIEAGRALAGCSRAVVARDLPRLAAVTHGWERLARLHGDLVLADVRATFEATPARQRDGLWSRLAAPLRALLRARPADVLDLALERAAPGTIPTVVERRLRSLGAREPARVATLLLRPAYQERLVGVGLPRGALAAARALPAAARERLARTLARSPAHLASLLAKLPPAWRGALFERAFEGLDRSALLLPDALLDALPHAGRDREAARMEQVREVREDPDRALDALAGRTVEHARPALEAACRASDADDRGRAYALLVRCTARARRGVQETLAFLARLENDQDPVRLCAWTALAAVPPSAITDAHLPLLEPLVTHLLDARDASLSSCQALERVVLRLMRADPGRGARFDFGVAALDRLQAAHGLVPDDLRVLPRGAEGPIVVALLPRLRAAAEREEYSQLEALVRALGRRAWAQPELQALLEVGANDTDADTARDPIDLWLQDPRARDARVTRLLERDASAIVCPRVLDHLHRRRQDLLDRHLTGPPPAGRFSSGAARWLLPVRSGLHRWLPRQQRALGAILAHVASDATRPTTERVAAIRTLARAPAVEADVLARFARDPEVAVAEAALAALSTTDRGGEALPVLLEQSGGKHARVAMYAVARSAQAIDPARLGAQLDELLRRGGLRVTVHKEALRLLGAFRTPRSLEVVLREARRTDAHKDVRIAAGHAARALLDREEAWGLLEELAGSAERFIAQSVVEVAPATVAPAARARYARLIVTTTSHADPRVRRLALQALPAWSAGVEDEVARVAAARVLDLASAVDLTAALGALVDVVRDGLAQGVLVEAVRALVLMPTAPAHDATLERDLPARQRLEALLTRLSVLDDVARRALAPAFRALAAELARDPTLAARRAGLLVDALAWDFDPRAPRALAADLAAIAEEAAPRATVLAAVVDRARSRAIPASARDPEGLLQLVARVLDAPTRARALLGLALLALVGPRLLWRADAADLLRRLRRHEDPDVRAAACMTWTRPE